MQKPRPGIFENISSYLDNNYITGCKPGGSPRPEDLIGKKETSKKRAKPSSKKTIRVIKKIGNKLEAIYLNEQIKEVTNCDNLLQF